MYRVDGWQVGREYSASTLPTILLLSDGFEIRFFAFRPCSLRGCPELECFKTGFFLEGKERNEVIEF